MVYHLIKMSDTSKQEPFHVEIAFKMEKTILGPSRNVLFAQIFPKTWRFWGPLKGADQKQLIPPFLFQRNQNSY